MKASSRIYANNHSIKVLSIIFGYLLWLIFAHSNNINITYDIPLAFYNLPNNLYVESQECMLIHLAGTRKNLSRIDIMQPGIHINLEHIKNEGIYSIPIKQEDILLPNDIKLLNYLPSKLTINVKAKK